MSPLFAAPDWADKVPLLAIIGAMAAYIGAIRLWYHKVRTDAIDNYQKEQKDALQKVSQLPRRYANAVMWLRGLIVFDVTVLVGAVALFWHTFHDYLPRFEKRPGYHMDGFSFAIQIMWFVLLAMCLAHVVSCFDALNLKEILTPNKVAAATPGTEADLAAREAAERKNLRNQTLWTVGGGLVVVLILFFGLAYIPLFQW